MGCFDKEGYIDFLFPCNWGPPMGMSCVVACLKNKRSASST